MTWLRAHRGDLALVLLVLACAAPVVQELKTQQASRLALTAAIWDDGSVRIDDYPLGVDRAEHEGHLYSDKAPGQPVFAVPAYAAYRLAGGEPAKVFRYDGNLGLWVTSVWSSLLPVAALLLLVRRAADETVPGTGLAVAALTYVATLLLPFSSLLFGHGLSTFLAFAGWYVVRRPEPTDGALIASGALLGSSVLVEYTLVLAAAAVGVALLVTVRTRVWRFAAGGVPFALLLLAYQWVAFDSPFAFSYAQSSFGEASRSLGDQDQDPALVENALRVLAGERGLLVVSPVVLLAGVGLGLHLRSRRRGERALLAAAALSAASVVAVQMAWSNPTGGDAPGPRYATAAAAFLAPGLAVALGRWPRWTKVTGALGALVMLAATWTDPLEARDSTGAVGIWLEKLFEGDWALTVYELGLGAWGAALLPLGAAAAAIALVRAVSPRRAARA